jgi:hypothetical protein
MFEHLNCLLAGNRKFRWLLCFLTGLLIILVPGGGESSSHAQTSVNRVTITEILDSSEVYIQNVQTRVNQSATLGQVVRTGRARTQLRFNTGAIARMSQNSVLTVGQCANLQRGVLLVNGAMNGCTSSVVAGVRGTTYAVTVLEGQQEQIFVLEGEVEVNSQSSQNSPIPQSVLSAPQNPQLIEEPPVSEEAEFDTTQVTVVEQEPLLLTAGQRLTIDLNRGPHTVESLSAEEFAQILNGDLFQGFRIRLPGLRNIRASYRALFPGVPVPRMLGLPNLLPRPGLPF